MSIIQSENDPIGSALLDYIKGNTSHKISVTMDVAEEEMLDPAYFFRKESQMPPIERKSLALAKGKVLDVGAGGGAHSLVLQDRGFDVLALDSSPGCVEAMKHRGVIKAVCGDVFDFDVQTFDTILLLMNGLGIAGDMKGLERLLTHLKTILKTGGQILADSSDIKYLFEEEDGSFWIDINSQKYYGEVGYELKYKTIEGDPFPWLFVASDILTAVAAGVGLKSEIIAEGEHYDYLMKFTHL